MITAVPGNIPVTTPLPEPMVATEGLPLLHVPPPGHDNVVVPPTHTVVIPVIGLGDGIIVIKVETEQPVGNV